MNRNDKKYMEGLSIQELKWITRKLHLKSSPKRDVLMKQLSKYESSCPISHLNYKDAISQLKREKRLRKLKPKKQAEKAELLEHLRAHLATAKVAQLEKILNTFYKSKYGI